VFGAERALAVHEAVDVVGLIAFILKPAIIFVLDGLTCGDETQTRERQTLGVVGVRVRAGTGRVTVSARPQWS
jgi:hypothetical protein